MGSTRVAAMKSKWIDYQGRRIFYIDLSGFGRDELAFDKELTETVTTVGQEMYAQPLNTILVLVDLRDTNMTREIQKLISERIADTRKYIRKTAVVGMAGIQKIFLDYFARLAGSATVGFGNTEAAMQWLIR